MWRSLGKLYTFQICFLGWGVTSELKESHESVLVASAPATTTSIVAIAAAVAVAPATTPATTILVVGGQLWQGHTFVTHHVQLSFARSPLEMSDSISDDVVFLLENNIWCYKQTTFALLGIHEFYNPCHPYDEHTAVQKGESCAVLCAVTVNVHGYVTHSSVGNDMIIHLTVL